MQKNYRMFQRLISISIVAILLIPAMAATWDVETVNTKGSGDITDDSCIWLHPSEPSKSVVFGTNKSKKTNGGLYAYDLDGSRAGNNGAWDNTNWFSQAKKVNNVDIRYNFKAGEASWDIVAASNRTDDRVDLYKVETNGGGDFKGLKSVGSFSTIALGGDHPYGLAMYHSKSQDKHYVIASSKDGAVAQWALSYSDGAITGTKVWQANVSKSEIEGIVADDEKDVVYIAGEDTSIYRYKTSAGTIVNTGRVTVDTADTNKAGKGHLAADIEGLTMYYGTNGSGYLIASSQGEDASGHRNADTFAVYDRKFTRANPNAYKMNFSVNDGVGSDHVRDTDGIDVISANLGGAFKTGMFVVHDGRNPGGPSNLKFVSWDDIANEYGGEEDSLSIDTGWNPRSVMNR